MSAVLKDQPCFGRMGVDDLDAVIAIEEDVYTHPWTRGNFADSLKAGYHCATLTLGGELLGYFVLLVAVGEAHLLNLSVSAARHRQGIGSVLLREVLRLGREGEARHVFLEVRPSNAAAIALYEGSGFKRIAERPGYYPAHGGRENALVLTLDL
jgi:ribosomal-protein-alanine N-acetyltransferase